MCLGTQLTARFQNFDFFCFKLINFCMFFDHFDVLIPKMNFKKIKKHYLDAFSSEAF
jgi:hypothetical protein